MTPEGDQVNTISPSTSLILRFFTSMDYRLILTFALIFDLLTTRRKR